MNLGKKSRRLSPGLFSGLGLWWWRVLVTCSFALVFAIHTRTFRSVCFSFYVIAFLPGGEKMKMQCFGFFRSKLKIWRDNILCRLELWKLENRCRCLLFPLVYVWIIFQFIFDIKTSISWATLIHIQWMVSVWGVTNKADESCWPAKSKINNVAQKFIGGQHLLQ